MRKNVKRMVWSLWAVVVLLCAGCKSQPVFYDSEETLEEPLRAEKSEEDEEAEEKAPAKICVYVCGEVRNPGVYELEAEARTAAAVEAAGGMTEEAAESWLNLAEHLADGQKIEVPSREQEEKLKEEALAAESSLVNLNQASAEELTTLRGIGESKAEDILKYRETHGGFQTIEELMQIPGIKERVFEKIKDQITV